MSRKSPKREVEIQYRRVQMQPSTYTPQSFTSENTSMNYKQRGIHGNYKIPSQGVLHSRNDFSDNIPTWFLTKIYNDSLRFKSHTSFRDLRFYIFPYQMSYQARLKLSQQIQRFFGDVELDHHTLKYNVVVLPNLRKYCHHSYIQKIARISADAADGLELSATSSLQTDLGEKTRNSTSQICTHHEPSLESQISNSSSLVNFGNSTSYKRNRLTTILSTSQNRMNAKTNPGIMRQNSFVGEVSCDVIEDYLFERMVRAAYRDRDCLSLQGLPESKILFIKDNELRNMCEYLQTQMWEYHAKRGAQIKIKEYPSAISCLKQCRQNDNTYNPQTHIFKNTTEKIPRPDNQAQLIPHKVPLVPVLWPEAPRLSALFVTEKNRKAQEKKVAELEKKYHDDLEALRSRPKIFFKPPHPFKEDQNCMRCGMQFFHMNYLDHIQQRGHKACEHTQKERLQKYASSFTSQREKLGRILRQKEKLFEGKQAEEEKKAEMQEMGELLSPERDESILLHKMIEQEQEMAKVQEERVIEPKEEEKKETPSKRKNKRCSAKKGKKTAFADNVAKVLYDQKDQEPESKEVSVVICEMPQETKEIVEEVVVITEKKPLVGSKRKAAAQEGAKSVKKKKVEKNKQIKEWNLESDEFEESSVEIDQVEWIRPAREPKQQTTPKRKRKASTPQKSAEPTFQSPLQPSKVIGEPVFKRQISRMSSMDSLMTSMMATPVISIENFDLKKTELAEPMKIQGSLSALNPSFVGVSSKDASLVNFIESKALQPEIKKMNRPVQEINFSPQLVNLVKQTDHTQKETYSPSPKRTPPALPAQPEFEQALKLDSGRKESIMMSQESRNSSHSRANSAARDPVSVVLQARKNAKLNHLSNMSAYNKKIQDYFQHHGPHKQRTSSQKRMTPKFPSQQHRPEQSPRSQDIVPGSQREVQSQKSQLKDSPSQDGFSQKMQTEEKMTPLKSMSSIVQRTLGSSRSLLAEMEGAKKSGRKSGYKKKSSQKGKIKNHTLEKFFMPSSSKKTISDEMGLSDLAMSMISARREAE